MASGDGGTRHCWPIEEGVNLWNGNLHFLLGPTTCVTCGGDSTVICSFEYELDAAGNRLSVTDKDGKYTAYGMDPTQQLKSDTKWSAKTPGSRSWQRAYKYDPNGNRLAEWHNGVVTNYTIGDNNEITQSVKGSTTLNFSTDHFGNLYNISTPAPVLVAGLTYDNESHLIEITDTAHDDSHTYDGDGRRMSSILNGAANDTFFIHDELTGNVIGEYTLVSGTFTLRSVNTWGIGLLSTNRESTKRYFHFDGLGSTAALTNSSEAVTDTYAYSAFGIEETTGQPSVNPFRFCGQWGYYDDGAMGSFYKMLLLGVRYYWPEYGRFFTWDPVKTDNAYRYALNKPTLLIDPTGAVPDCPQGFDVHHICSWSTTLSVKLTKCKAGPNTSTVCGLYCSSINNQNLKFTIPGDCLKSCRTPMRTGKCLKHTTPFHMKAYRFDIDTNCHCLCDADGTVQAELCYCCSPKKKPKQGSAGGSTL